VLADVELGLIYNGVPVRGTDLLAALLPPSSPGRTGAYLEASVASLMPATAPKMAGAPSGARTAEKGTGGEQ